MAFSYLTHGIALELPFRWEELGEPERCRDKIELLLQAIYGPVLPDVVAELDGLLGWVLHRIEVIAIGRPPGDWTVEEVVRAIRHG